MGIRDQLRSLKRQANKDLDYLQLRDGSRYYFDPKEDPPALFFEMISKGYKSPSEEVETPSIRQALVNATPESVARFEERYGLRVTEKVRLVGFPDKDQSIVRRIELDGSVRTFLVDREDIREITPEEEAGLLAVPDLSE